MLLPAIFSCEPGSPRWRLAAGDIQARGVIGNVSIPASAVWTAKFKACRSDSLPSSAQRKSGRGATDAALRRPAEACAAAGGGGGVRAGWGRAVWSHRVLLRQTGRECCSGSNVTAEVGGRTLRAVANMTTQDSFVLRRGLQVTTWMAISRRLSHRSTSPTPPPHAVRAAF